MKIKITTSVLKVLIDNNQILLITKLIKYIRDQYAAVDWKIVSSMKMSEEILELLKDFLIKEYVSVSQTLSISWMRDNPTKISYKYISKYQVLDRPFIRDFITSLDINNIIRYQESICDETDSTFIEELEPYFDKNLLLTYRKVPEAWIEDNYADLDKELISKHKLSEAFMDAHFADLNKDSLIVYGSIDTEELFIKYSGLYPDLNRHKALEFIQFSEEYLLNNIYTFNPFKILRYQKNISKYFILGKLNWFDTYFLSKYTGLDNATLSSIPNIVYNLISKYSILNNSYISENKHLLNKKLISKYQILETEYLLNNPLYFDYHYVQMYQVLDISVMEKYIAKFNIDLLFIYQGVDEEFVRFCLQRKPSANLNNLLIYQADNISEVFVLEYFDRFNKSVISRYKQLSLSTIDSLKDKLDMYNISKYQASLTESWINTNKEILNIDNILNNTNLNLSDVFKESLALWFLNTKEL